MTTYPKRLKINLLTSLFIYICAGIFIAEAQTKAITTIAHKVGSPALQIAHVKDGKTHLINYGLKEQGKADTISAQTSFQAASLSKVITAYTFFRLVDKGLISLDVPLWDYYPYDRLAETPGKERITARMVLSHRSGLLNWEGDVPSAAWRASPLSLLFDPGTAYAYSGEGFYFLQEVMEHLSGKALEDLVQEELLTPLGMRNSAMRWQERFAADAAYGHDQQGKPKRFAKYAKANAAYTLYTTAEDYTRFVQEALLGGEGLTSDSHQLMCSYAAEAQKGPQATPEDAHVPCTLGLRLQLNEVGTALWHTGSNPGFRCFFIAYPKQKESLVVFMNSDSALPAMQDLLALFLQDKQTFWSYTWRQGELD